MTTHIWVPAASAITAPDLPAPTSITSSSALTNDDALTDYVRLTANLAGQASQPAIRATFSPVAVPGGWDAWYLVYDAQTMSGTFAYTQWRVLHNGVVLATGANSPWDLPVGVSSAWTGTTTAVSFGDVTITPAMFADGGLTVDIQVYPQGTPSGYPNDIAVTYLAWRIDYTAAPPLRHRNRDDGLANSMARKGPKGPTSSQESIRRGPRAYS